MTMRSEQSPTNAAPGLVRIGVGIALAHAGARLLGARAPASPSMPAERPAKRSRRDLIEEALLWNAIWILGLACALAAGRLASMGFGVHPIEHDRDLLFRLFVSTLVPVPVLVLYRPAWRRLRAPFWTTWWDPSRDGADGPIGWSDVLRMAAGSEAGDALTSPEHLRRKRLRRRVVPYALCLSAALFAVAMVIDGLLIWRLPSFFGSLDKQPGTLLEATANMSSNLTAYLALIAAAISIVFTYRQLRAKVRADNRQAWIDRARRLLSELAQRPGTPATTSGTDRLARFRIELELMLNPSEKDHRLLIYLLQRLHLQSRADAIAGARTLLAVVRGDLAAAPSPETIERLESIERADPEHLIGYIVRLSHVVLKREWERVKHTR